MDGILSALIAVSALCVLLLIVVVATFWQVIWFCVAKAAKTILAFLLWPFVFCGRVTRCVLNLVWSVMMGIVSLLGYSLSKTTTAYQVFRKAGYREVPTVSTEYTEGKLVLNDGKFYYEVLRPTGKLMVLVGPEALFFRRNLEEESHESFVSQNRATMKSTMPTGQVIFRDGENIVGYGVRCTIGGKEGVLTAAHVLTTLRRHPDMTIGTLTGQMSFETDWELLIGSRKADIAFVSVPQKVWSILGVGKAKVSRLPATNTPISIAWKTSEGVASYMGVVLTKKLIFNHTVNTTHGVSGAPIFWNGCVVGVHQQGRKIDAPNANSGVALDPFIKLQETYEREGALMDYEDLVEGDDSDVLMGGRALVLKSSKNMYKLKSDPAKLKLYDGKTWADWADEEDDYWEDSRESALNPDTTPIPEWETALEEKLNPIEPVFRLRRVPALQSTSERTSGKIWVPKNRKGPSERALPESGVADKGFRGEAKREPTESATASQGSCPNSKIGTGQKRALKLFARASSIMPLSSGQGTDRVEKSGKEQLMPSSEVILRSGRIPKATREFISSLGVSKCGKNRMWLLPGEVTLLEGLRTKEAERALVFKQPCVLPLQQS